MADRFDPRGARALVTGASAGIGVALARELARRGAHPILVARRRTPMDALADELRASHGVVVEVHDLDLTAPDALAELEARVPAASVPILVNNAGFGIHRPLVDCELDELRRMIELDLAVLVELTWRHARAMRDAGRGRILQVASTAAFLPIPDYGLYAALKAAVLHLGEALDHELRDAGVRCTVLCPGTTESEFFDVAGHALSRAQRLAIMPAAAVARAGVDALLRGRRLAIPGLANRLLPTLLRLVPRGLAARLAAAATRDAAVSA